MEEVRKIIISDVDDTVVDPSLRLETCKKETGDNKRLFWNCFLSDKYLYLDLPILRTIRFLQRYWGTDIIFITGRTENMRKGTIMQFSVFNIPWTEIIFRKEKDFRKDYIYKAEAVQNIIERYLAMGKKPEILFMVDDSEDVRREIENRFNIKAIDPSLLSL